MFLWVDRGHTLALAEIVAMIGGRPRKKPRRTQIVTDRGNVFTRTSLKALRLRVITRNGLIKKNILKGGSKQ